MLPESRHARIPNQLNAAKDFRISSSLHRGHAPCGQFRSSKVRGTGFYRDKAV